MCFYSLLLLLFALLLFVRLVKFAVVVAVAVGAPILYYNNSQDNSSVAQAVDVKIAIKMFTPKREGRSNMFSPQNETQICYANCKNRARQMGMLKGTQTDTKCGGASCSLLLAEADETRVELKEVIQYHHRYIRTINYDEIMKFSLYFLIFSLTHFMNLQFELERILSTQFAEQNL